MEIKLQKKTRRLLFSFFLHCWFACDIVWAYLWIVLGLTLSIMSFFFGEDALPCHAYLTVVLFSKYADWWNWSYALKWIILYAHTQTLRSLALSLYVPVIYSLSAITHYAGNIYTAIIGFESIFSSFAVATFLCRLKFQIRKHCETFDLNGRVCERHHPNNTISYARISLS